MKSRKHIQALLVAAFCALMVSGCASTHNLKTDGDNLLGGGGFLEQEVVPGLYRLTASSNRAIVPAFGAAMKTWNYRADQLCGTAAHQSFATDSFKGQGATMALMMPSGGTLFASNYNATITGYLLCNSTGMSVADAVGLLRSRQLADERATADRLREDLEQAGGADCAKVTDGISSELYFRRGKALHALERYADSRACYVLAQQVEKDTTSYYYRQACEAIGWMYELGYGVEKDLQTARIWYQKAGML